MPTLTIRKVPEGIVRRLKESARRNKRSMEEEVRVLLEGHVMEMDDVLRQIEAGWARQNRRPTAREVQAWKQQGRP